jgi:uncharacterized protein
MKFEWDENKNRINIHKHGVSFEEAKTCLFDEQALVFEDPDCETENRWVLIGMNHEAKLLVVIYTLRGEQIRLISARKPTKKEVKNYA